MTLADDSHSPTLCAARDVLLSFHATKLIAKRTMDNVIYV